MFSHFFKVWIDSQYENPRGLIGVYIGEKMVRQHQIESSWTIDQLHIQPRASILELGCGAGDTMATILRNRPDVHVTGLDRSGTLVASATKRNRTAIAMQRASVLQGDLQSLPIQDSCMDHIFSIHTLYFWKDIEVVLSEIHRVLKPGGTFVITYCDGKGDVHWDGISTSVRDIFIPHSTTLGFENVTIHRGPDSRDYHTVAVTGRKTD